MKTEIQFQSAEEAAHNEANHPTWPKSQPGSYRDEILKPQYRPRKLRFATGQNWLRVVPAFANSSCPWMMTLQVQSFAGGQFIHPRTFEPGAKSVFDRAYAWMRQYRPEMLYSKGNKGGIRLLPDPQMLCWVLVEENNVTVARLIYASGYDSSRGGVAGIGHQLFRAAREVDATGKVVADGVDPAAGFRFCLEKTQTPGAKYPSYSLRASHVSAPIGPILEKMSEEEIGALVPLDQVVQRLSEEDQWECLQAHLDAEIFAKIREHCSE